MIRLYKGLNIGDSREMISIVGAGGKTSTMFLLGKMGKSKGLRVLITTTTKIYYPRDNSIDNIYILDRDALDLQKLKKRSISVIGKEISQNGKLLGVNPEVLDEIYRKRYFDLILVEADGSKNKSIKAPGEHEPVIPLNTTKTIGLIGLDSLGFKIYEENVYRSEIFANITGSKLGESINLQTIKNLVLSSRGLFKGVPDKSEKYLIFNKADNKNIREKGRKIARDIMEKSNHIDDIILASFHNNFIEKVK
ncbi:putative selenium-dependent hydroxylase accessory protein YqeC [Clostridium sp. D2Q-14]|uniref:selenium cofactor biosynthesis protein YqeC n=1 Tax=Anaeromonas gelatinilytica TaxID=2683194 RepID=UPI00193B2A6C|nr:selenium cofactor biosynthesis protein YqeC [Anaeromonas gelatinilytica]MBS4534569.1 putative selenium-dependent hydroxylase accessory protein YqeC [Anaeromonas gelatinilytica]